MSIKISVIIPTYKRINLLKECLDSFVNQTLAKEDYEIIVSDNNSRDGTKEFVEEYIKQHLNTNIKYALEERPGLVYSRHNGVKNSTSEILLFVDDDGEYNPECLNAILDVYSQFPDAVAAGGRIDIVWDKKPAEWLIEYQPYQGELNYDEKAFCKKNLYINGGLYSIKKEVLYELGGFNPDQVGEFYIGDGETGLCRKMHNKGYSIAWTPFAIMQHKQFVANNGKLKDLQRRFFNTGICDSYRIMDDLNFVPDFNLIKHNIKRLIKYYINSLKFYFKDDKFKIENLKEFLALELSKGQAYFFIFFMKKDFRAKCRNRDWF